jgi:hypothetical protein
MNRLIQPKNASPLILIALRLPASHFAKSERSFQPGWRLPRAEHSGGRKALAFAAVP